MPEQEINRLIQEKLSRDIHDENIREFIKDILQIEREYEGKRGKIKEYKKVLAEYTEER